MLKTRLGIFLESINMLDLYSVLENKLNLDASNINEITSMEELSKMGIMDYEQRLIVLNALRNNFY